MTRAVVHFGLHKTGTSTAEATLFDNAATLAPRIHLVGRKSWPEVSQAAKTHSEAPDRDELDRFATGLSKRLAGLDRDRDLLIANVDLSGRLPSLLAAGGYGALPTLLAETARRFAAWRGGEVIFLATLRDPDGWLASLYWQTLKVSRETLAFADFAERYANLAGFAPLMDDIREAIAPAGARLVTARLEQTCATPLGPATPLLAAIGLGDAEIAALTPHKRLKPSPAPEVRDAMLDLNRSDLADDDLADAKAMLVDLAGRGA